MLSVTALLLCAAARALEVPGTLAVGSSFELHSLVADETNIEVVVDPDVAEPTLSLSLTRGQWAPASLDCVVTMDEGAIVLGAVDQGDGECAVFVGDAGPGDDDDDSTPGDDDDSTPGDDDDSTSGDDDDSTPGDDDDSTSDDDDDTLSPSSRAAPVFAVGAASLVVSSRRPTTAVVAVAAAALASVALSADAAETVAYKVTIRVPPQFAFASFSTRVQSGRVQTAGTAPWDASVSSCAPRANPGSSISSNPGIPANDQTPEITMRFDTVGEWRKTGKWGGADLEGADDGFRIPGSEWEPEIFYTERLTPLPPVRPESAGFDYRVSFEFRHDAGNEYSGGSVALSDAIPRVDLLFLEPRPSYSHWGLPDDPFRTVDDEEDPWGTELAFMSATVTGLSLGTTWTTVEATMRSTSDLMRTDVNLAIRFAGIASGGRHINSWYIRNIRVVIPPKPFVAPAMFPLDSEIVTLEAMPEPEGANAARTACPHLQSGLLRWDDPATWPGNAVPAAGSSPTLPAGAKVLLSGCAVAAGGYGTITVPASSELILDETDMDLVVENIIVRGHLWAGSETCRLDANVHITLTGARTAADATGGFGSKAIGVSGELDLHGRLFHPTWTRLAGTAHMGDNRITLQDPVNWEVGQQLVVLTSVYRDELDPQNEVRTITAISADARTLRLDRPLDFMHYAGSEYQTEVGLLSRRIVIQGDAQSEDEYFGGHIRITGEGRVSGVQVYRMGQLNVLASYPLHFHILGDGASHSYVQDSAIWRSFFRCITIHGTSDARISRNVAFDARASCYYLEDGVEERNTIEYNLAAYVHPLGTPASGGGQGGVTVVQNAQHINPADTSAAGFYVTNAYNRIVGNAASGGWTGFAFPNLPAPIGDHRSVNRDPSGRPALEFRANTAHSSGHFWWSAGCIYTGGHLAYNDDNLLQYNSGRNERATRDQIEDEEETWQSEELWHRFDDTKVWLCMQGIQHWGDRAEIVNYECHDCEQGSTTFGESWVDNALINAVSGNPGRGDMEPAKGSEVYDTFVKTLFSRITYRNFRDDGVSRETRPDVRNNFCAISSLTHSDVFKPQLINAVRGLRFENTDDSQKYCHFIQGTGSDRYFNVLDYDGSFSGSGVPTLVGSQLNWWQIDSDCYMADWLVEPIWMCPDSETRTVAHLGAYVPNEIVRGSTSMEDFHTAHIGQSCLWSAAAGSYPTDRCSPVTRNPGITGPVDASVGWWLVFEDGSPQTIEIDPSQTPEGSAVLLAMPYPSGTTFSVRCDYEWNNSPELNFDVSEVQSLAAVQAGNGREYFFDGENIYLKLMALNIPADSGFSRAGMFMPNVGNSLTYTVTASCSGSGGFCSHTPVHPNA